MKCTDSISHPISEKQWDDFVAFVIDQLLERHPETRSDSLMAFRLGGSISTHYSRWKNEAINMAEPLHVKIAHLLSYWKATNHFDSMRDLLKEFDEKLSSEKSFNSMREEIKRHFL